MFNKTGVILIITMLIFSLAACSPQNQAESSKTDDWAQYIGKMKDEVFQKLNLEEGKDAARVNGLRGNYLLTQEQKFYGEVFQLELHFDMNTDVMYGYTYIKDYSKDEPKQGYDLTIKLKETLIKELGNPISYPGLSNLISDIPEFDKLTPLATYTETWEVNKNLTVELQFKYSQDDGARVILHYQPATTPRK